MPHIIHQAKIRRLKKVRQKLKSSCRPRLSVFRSLRYFYAQIIDDKTGRTLLSASTHGLKTKTGKIDQVTILGEKLAQAAVAKKIFLVKFDRGLYKFHGRVKAFAAGARRGGLKF